MASSWQELKAEGNAAYAAGDLEQAAEKYTAALQTDIVAADRATVLCNRAQCFLKLEKFAKAIEDCTACLTSSPDNVKALFRRYGTAAFFRSMLATALLCRAVAYEQNGSKAEAAQDYDTVLKLNPTIEEASTGYQRYLLPQLTSFKFVTSLPLSAGALERPGERLQARSRWPGALQGSYHLKIWPTFLRSRVE
jgi:tetratricopeptide (TPR) repeat protein